MFSYWAYILIGDNNTGKTSFQKHLISELCAKRYERLPLNLRCDIVQSRMPRGVRTLSAMNRSYQEKVQEYKSVKNFFVQHFQEADICFLSSHAHASSDADIQEMIRELRIRSYNVAAVFFSNGYDNAAEQISLLDWDERLWIENPSCKREENIQLQLARLAKEFAMMLVARSAHW